MSHWVLKGVHSYLHRSIFGCLLGIYWMFFGPIETNKQPMNNRPRYDDAPFQTPTGRFFRKIRSRRNIHFQGF
ncbi:hypothetical protein [Saccharicrinis aurantiacus]|uniref:hypothetical protein n=1 Tax=Saccharicrinis aurantiacus TaxID=1849719 RepID=UPI0024923586|nr:hypothetical protein [Saccharicrinis aurantiacus]